MDKFKVGQRVLVEATIVRPEADPEGDILVGVWQGSCPDLWVYVRECSVRPVASTADKCSPDAELLDAMAGDIEDHHARLAHIESALIDPERVDALEAKLDGIMSRLVELETGLVSWRQAGRCALGSRGLW